MEVPFPMDLYVGVFIEVRAFLATDGYGDGDGDFMILTFIGTLLSYYFLLLLVMTASVRGTVTNYFVS